jgi:transposase
MTNQKQAPKFDMIAIFILIWKKYGFIFKNHEAARSKHFGRKRINPKSIFRAIMFILWTGGSWRSLPRGMGKRSTVHDYFLDWAQAGLFGLLWETIALDAAADGLINPELQVIDGTHILTVYMPPDLAGWSYKNPGKRGVKISILIDAQGIPVSLEVDAANKHDAKMTEGTLSNTVIEAVEPAKKTLLGDSGFIGEDQEQTAADFGFRSNFRPKKTQIKNYSNEDLTENKKNRWKVGVSRKGHLNPVGESPTRVINSSPVAREAS